MAVISDKFRLTIGEKVTISGKDHKALVTYLTQRLDGAKLVHDHRVTNMAYIDKSLQADLVLSDEDQQRAIANEKLYGIRPVDFKSPTCLSHLEDAATALLGIISPESGMYEAIAPVQEQAVAKAFTTLLNTHDTAYGHYVNVKTAVLAALKYNRGGVSIDWQEDFGLSLSNDNTNQPKLVKKVVRSGNNIKSLSMYNTLYDVTVPFVDLPTHGEFFATVMPYSSHSIERMINDNLIYNATDITRSGSVKRYYSDVPELKTAHMGHHGGSVINFARELAGPDGVYQTTYTELVTVRIWLNPAKLGIKSAVTKNELQIWRLVLANGNTIVEAEPLTNSHGRLPLAVMELRSSEQHLEEKSYAELLLPYNVFISFMLNVHQRDVRKARHGTTYYGTTAGTSVANPDFNEDVTHVPIVTGVNEKVSDKVAHFPYTPQTADTFANIEAISALMQTILPTNHRQQITDLNRASRFQAAAAVASYEAPMNALARIVDSQMMNGLRLITTYNVLEYQTTMKLVDQQGNSVDINPAEFRDTQLEFKISAGLSGVNKLGLVDGYIEILNSVLQSGVAGQQIDVTKFINHLTTFMGDYADFSQFKIQSQMDTLPPDQRDLAFQLLQQYIAQQQTAQAGGGAPPTAQQTIA